MKPCPTCGEMHTPFEEVNREVEVNHKAIKHIGIFSGRLAKAQNNPREVAFHKQWLKEQEEGRILSHLIGEKLTQRDATVASTVIQWLGSNVGMSFLEEAILREPQIKKWLQQRAFSK